MAMNDAPLRRTGIPKVRFAYRRGRVSFLDGVSLAARRPPTPATMANSCAVRQPRPPRRSCSRISPPSNGPEGAAVLAREEPLRLRVRRSPVVRLDRLALAQRFVRDDRGSDRQDCAPHRRCGIRSTPQRPRARGNEVSARGKTSPVDQPRTARARDKDLGFARCPC